MKIVIGTALNIILFLIFDTIWMKSFGSAFYRNQISGIARLTPEGDWDVRLLPAFLVYVLMALLIEIFITSNKSIVTGQQYLIFGALLGFMVFGVFDLTNRAVIDQYPLAFVIVDMCWGTFLFGAVSFLSFFIKGRLTFF